MSNKNQHSSPDQTPSVSHEGVAVENFQELTYGVERNQLYPFLVDMREITDLGGAKVDGEVITFTPGNLSNGSLIPVLHVEGDVVRTTLTGYGGNKIAFGVTPLTEGMAEIGKIRGVINLREDATTQDVLELKKIPDSHWRAMKIAIDLIEGRKQAGMFNDGAKKRGGFVRRLLRI